MLRPTRIVTSPLDTLSSGAGYTCGIVSGMAMCWGANEYGQLGIEGTEFQFCGGIRCVPRPVPVSAGGVFAQLAAGGGHTCGVDETGDVYCWGYGAYGRLGTSTNANQPLPVEVNAASRFRQVVTSGAHTCALSVEGAAYCWGYGEGGQIGHGANTTAQITPAAVAGGHIFADIAAGTLHTCALRIDGAVFCWGINAHGELGNGTTTHSNVPVRAGTQRFISVAAGGNHTCGIEASGGVYCWGNNGSGQLGDGTRIDRSVPTPMKTGLRFSSISPGYEFTCGITTDGRAMCWGLNYRGALGIANDEPISATAPLPVVLPDR